jgi:hypothetical protein
MNKQFLQVIAVVAVIGVVAGAGTSMVFAYGGSSFVGGGIVFTPTPTPTPVATDVPEILGASTQLPSTGVDAGTVAKMVVFALSLAAGIMLVATDSKLARR